MKTPTEKQNAPKEQTTDPALPRLGFSMKETAQIIGRSYLTVWNLVQRGKLKANRDLRTPVIPRSEIERWLGS